MVALLQDLDPGEAEAIALAVEADAELVIIVERLGRRTAQHFGLNVIGVIGILTDAKHHGLIREIKPVLDRLRTLAGFRVSDALCTRILRDNQEDE